MEKITIYPHPHAVLFSGCQWNKVEMSGKVSLQLKKECSPCYPSPAATTAGQN